MHMYILHTKISFRYHSVLMTIFCGWPVAILFKKPLHELLGRSKCRYPFVLLCLNYATWSIPRDSNPQQPRCKRGTLTNCVRNRGAGYRSRTGDFSMARRRVAATPNPHKLTKLAKHSWLLRTCMPVGHIKDGHQCLSRTSCLLYVKETL